jgi:hypothetical protein
MPAIYLTNPIVVDNRLETLGWSREELLEVVGAMVSARRSCTENDPSSAPGWMAWKDGTRRLREIGRAKGLSKADFDQIPCVVDDMRRLRFSVCNTDDGTAVEGRTPQNRSKKGPGTERAATNNQGSLFDLFEALKESEASAIIPLSRIRPQPGIIVSWFLLTYCEGDEIRAELSCPIETEGGFFADFYERIVLVGPDDDGGGLRRQLPDDGPEFDIPVVRK